MGNRADATRLDPYGEYGHIKAVSLEEAARLYREALKTPRDPSIHVEERIKTLHEAEHLLKISAWGAK